VTRAGIYARKSTVDERTAEDGKSVARQVAAAKAFAKSKGSTVADENIFVDEKVSGAEFIRRPGLNLLLDAVERKAFDVLVVWEQSRLGRDTFRTGSLIQTIEDAGIKIVSYSDGSAITLEGDMGEFGTFMKGHTDAAAKKLASKRVREAHGDKTVLGHATGQRTLGYDLKRVGDHTERVINRKQADIIKRIFEMSAAGEGDRAIAQTLNRESVPYFVWSTKKSDGLRPDGWIVGGAWKRITVGRILSNETYLGRQIWGKKKIVTKGGRAKMEVKQPKSAWIVTEIPSLRIISDALWEKVRAVKVRSRARHLAGGAHSGKGRPAKYLLTGIGKCGSCGGSLAVFSHGGPSTVRYYCSQRYAGAKKKCSNGQGIPVSALDAAVAGAVKTDLLSDIPRLEKICREHQDQYQRMLDAERKAAGPNPAVQIKTLEKKAGRLAATIANGGSPAVEKLLRETEGEIERLKAIEFSPALPAINLRAVLAGAVKDLKGGHGLLKGDPAKLWHVYQSAVGVDRDLLTRLGISKIVVVRKKDGWSLDGLANLSGLVGAVGNGSPLVSSEPTGSP